MKEVAKSLFNNCNEIINETKITDKDKDNLNRAFKKKEKKNKITEEYLIPADFDKFSKAVYEGGNMGGGGSENCSGGGCLALDIESVKNIALKFITNKFVDNVILWVLFYFVY
jgi:hypothetical protein